MAGFLHLKPGSADVYFEIAIPKMLHETIRKELKRKALKLIEQIDQDNVRAHWLGLPYEEPTPDPLRVRSHVVHTLCVHEPTTKLDITTAECEEDFYCWTDENRICYHPFGLLEHETKTRLVVESKNCGYDVTVDLRLVMAYAFDPSYKSQEQQTKVREVT